MRNLALLPKHGRSSRLVVFFALDGAMRATLYVASARPPATLARAVGTAHQARQGHPRVDVESAASRALWLATS